MEVQGKEDNGITVISPIGRVDTSTAKLFEEGVLKFIKDNGQQVVISFSSIDYISSAGLRVIVMTGKKLASLKGKLALIDMAPKIQEVFKMSGVDKIIKIYPNLQTARTEFGAA